MREFRRRKPERSFPRTRTKAASPQPSQSKGAAHAQALILNAHQERRTPASWAAPSKPPLYRIISQPSAARHPNTTSSRPSRPSSRSVDHQSTGSGRAHARSAAHAPRRHAAPPQAKPSRPATRAIHEVTRQLSIKASDTPQESAFDAHCRSRGITGHATTTPQRGPERVQARRPRRPTNASAWCGRCGRAVKA